jgi:hypothetical protein
MASHDGAIYEFRVAGHLDNRWADRFAALVIVRHIDGTCTLTGAVADQSELHGIITGLRDIGAPLLSLHALADDEERLTCC